MRYILYFITFAFIGSIHVHSFVIPTQVYFCSHRSFTNYKNNYYLVAKSTKRVVARIPNYATPSSPLTLGLSLDKIAESLFLSTLPIGLWGSIGLNAILFGILRTKLLKVLTPEGLVHSLALGSMLWSTLGWKGWTTCVLYLFLGSVVTKVKYEQKAALGIAEGRGGRRGPENVWGSAATALICAALSVQPSNVFGLSYDSLILGYVASLATKLADTFASEIGKAYGKTTFLITTFERVQPGTEGAISLEGTLAALVGGSLLPIFAVLVGFTNGWESIAIATLAAFLATNVESLIGATFQGKSGFQWMTNEVVNFLNTMIGAVIAITLSSLLL